MTAIATSHRTAFRQSWKACALVIVLTVTGALAVQHVGYLNHDVAFLTWVADHVMRGAVYGRDLYDINPPLNFMIYVPGALLGRIIGFDPAIRLWTVAIAALSIASLWQTADKSYRLPVIIALGLFFALAFPREFGQREQFALLLCAPYVAGHTPRRGPALLNGVMAGIGFALKPYFLIPLALVFLTRRRVRLEEVAIAITGLLYAASLVLFFRPYLTEYLPLTGASYWTHGVNSTSAILQFLFLVPAFVACIWWVSAPQPGRGGFAMAALGFTLAVVIHNKGYSYHFIPCFGFMILYLAASLRNSRPLAAWASAAFLVAVTFRLSMGALPWVMDVEQRRTTIPALLSEIDRSQSFWVLTNYNYPAFPTAILTTTPFTGISSNNNFFSAAVAIEAGVGKGDAETLARQARDQAVRELERKPALVIVNTEWARYAALRTPVDGLAWFLRDDRFRSLWSDYDFAGRVGTFDLYRRR
jgi:hypothetical protein